MPDWLKIKNEYIATGAQFEQLAKKYKIPSATIRSRARREGWQAEMKRQSTITETMCNAMTAQVVAKAEADRIAILMRIGIKVAQFLEKRIDKLLDSNAKAYEAKAIMETVKLIHDVYDSGQKPTDDDPLRRYLERLDKDG